MNTFELPMEMLRGFAWGLGVADREQEIKKGWELPALEKSLSAQLKAKIESLFGGQSSGKSLFRELDEIVDAHPEIEDLREYLVDLSLIRLISEGGEEFLDGPEWTEIESASEERGTELLNLLVYLRDCNESEQQPSLDDFLNEFLLVSDNEFQDEFFIYEELIRNQSMIEGSLKQIIQTGNAQRSPEMAEIFTPVMLFFRDREDTPGKLVFSMLNGSRLPALHTSIYWLLCHFWKTGS